MFGLVLIIIGFLFLFEKMGIITGSFWGYFWPIILIVVGLNFMQKDKSVDCYSFFGSPKKKKHHKVVDEQ